MASIRIKFRPSAADGSYGTIYYQIVHKRHVRHLSTDFQINSSEWNGNTLRATRDSSSLRISYISYLREAIRRDIDRINRIIDRLEQRGVAYTATDVVDGFNDYMEEGSLFNFMKSIVIKQRLNGKIRTSETYTSALNSFSQFRHGEDIMLDCITSDVMEAYEAFLTGKGLTPNSISFYMRILRAAYNRAVENGLITGHSPFRHVYTGVEKTVKRALPLHVVKKIKSLDLALIPALDYARDMFMLSFYLRGMSFVDMAFLRKANMHNGYVVYRRRKTGQQLTIKWTREMQAILDKYPSNTTQYLLPIITRQKVNERNVYRNRGYVINHNLKKIAGMIGLTAPLTMYVARHTWASAAKSKGIPVSVICEGMGHDSEATTQIYLASLQNSVVDRANSLILSSL